MRAVRVWGVLALFVAAAGRGLCLTVRGALSSPVRIPGGVRCVVLWVRGSRGVAWGVVGEWCADGAVVPWVRVWYLRWLFFLVL